MTVRVLSAEPLAASPPTRLGEGPAWDPQSQELIYVDILAGTAFRADEQGRVRRQLSFGAPLGAALPAPGGALLLATSTGFAHASHDGVLNELCDCVGARTDLRMNDAKCDPMGRAFGGTLVYRGKAADAKLYRLDGGPVATPVVTDVRLSNGLAWTSDGRQMYYVDIATGRVDVFSVDVEEGTPTARRPVISFNTLQGLPDGLTADDDGALWVALHRGGVVVRVTPNGQIDTVVQTPKLVTSAAFGGSDLGTLYITTVSEGLSDWELAHDPGAGLVHVVRPGVTGPAATLWGRQNSRLIFRGKHRSIATASGATVGTPMTQDAGRPARVVIVTGAGSGIGRAVARRFAGAGAAIGVLDIRADAAEEVAAAIRAEAGQAMAIATDTADPKQVRAAVNSVVAAFGYLDLLVSNAAVGSHSDPLELEPSEWERVLAVDLSGYFYCAQACAPHLARRSGASIVNVSSIAGSSAMGRGNLAYSVSKAGVEQMTRELAIEWAGMGVRVNAVAPCQVRTDGFAPVLEQADPEAAGIAERIVRGIPLGRIAEPEDVVSAIEFLASPAASMITGAVLAVDGGNLALNAGGTVRPAPVQGPKS